MTAHHRPNLHGAIDLSQFANSSPTTTNAPDVSHNATPNPYAVTTDNFAHAVVKGSENRLFLVDLGSPVKKDSRLLTQTLTSMADKSQGKWGLAVVDIQESPQIAAAFQIQTIPTVIAIYQGQPVTAFQGAQDESTILSWMNKIAEKLSLDIGDTSATSGLDIVEQAIAQGNIEEAQRAINELLVSEPLNDKAQQLKKHIDFIARAQTIDPQTVVLAESNPADDNLQIQAADVLMYQGKSVTAYNLLITAIVRAKKEERPETQLRSHLFELFALNGNTDPEVQKARTALANALF